MKEGVALIYMGEGSAIKLNVREVAMIIVSRVSKAVTGDRVPLECR